MERELMPDEDLCGTQSVVTAHSFEQCSGRGFNMTGKQEIGKIIDGFFVAERVNE